METKEQAKHRFFGTIASERTSLGNYPLVYGNSQYALDFSFTSLKVTDKSGNLEVAVAEGVEGLLERLISEKHKKSNKGVLTRTRLADSILFTRILYKIASSDANRLYQTFKSEVDSTEPTTWIATNTVYITSLWQNGKFGKGFYVLGQKEEAIVERAKAEGRLKESSALVLYDVKRRNSILSRFSSRYHAFVEEMPDLQQSSALLGRKSTKHLFEVTGANLESPEKIREKAEKSKKAFDFFFTLIGFPEDFIKSDTHLRSHFINGGALISIESNPPVYSPIYTVYFQKPENHNVYNIVLSSFLHNSMALLIKPNFGGRRKDVSFLSQDKGVSRVPKNLV